MTSAVDRNGATLRIGDWVSFIDGSLSAVRGIDGNYITYSNGDKLKVDVSNNFTRIVPKPIDKQGIELAIGDKVKGPDQPETTVTGIDGSLITIESQPLLKFHAHRFSKITPQAGNYLLSDIVSAFISGHSAGASNLPFDESLRLFINNLTK